MVYSGLVFESLCCYFVSFKVRCLQLNSIAMPLRIRIDYRTLHQQLMLLLQHLKYKSGLGTGGVQGQVKGQQLMGVKAVNDSIGLATCQSKIYEK